MTCPRITIIGGGIVGLATAFKLGRKLPSAQITVLEKETEVCRHQSGNNSGVLHAGLYYKPGSAKARMAVGGIQEMIAFCREHNVPHEICGKLVVAVDETELARLNALHERGQQNGLQRLRLLNREQMREIEPHVGGVAALHVPHEGIVDYPKVCGILQRKISERGGRVVTGAKVIRLQPQSNGWLAQSKAGDFETDFLVNCAGLWRCLAQHKRMSWEELKRSFSRRLFCECLQRLVPEIRPDDLETGGAGVRAQAMSPDGTLVQDFCFQQSRRALHVLNAPSPAATASLAIGEEIARMA